MSIIYRVLGFLIGLVAILFALSLLVIIPISISMPALWFPAFLLIAIVLYTWFSYKFQQHVLLRRQVVKHSLRDWIRVNGFVAIAFSILNIPPIITLLRNPETYIASTKEMLKQLGERYERSFREENVQILGYTMLVYMVGLLIHVLWTFALIKRNKEFFQ